MAIGDLLSNPNDPLKQLQGPWAGLEQQPQPQPPQPLSGGLRDLNQPRMQEEQQLQQKIQQLSNPAKPTGFWQNLRHVAATAGNIAGNIGLGQKNMAMIPGTEANKQQQLSGARGQLKSDQAQDIAEQEAAGKEELTGAETAHAGAETAEAQARTQALQNPADKPDRWTLQQTDHGMMRIDNVTGEVKPVTFNGQPLGPVQKETKEESPTIELQRQLLEAEKAGDAPSIQRIQKQLRDLNPQAEQRFNFQVSQAGAREGERGGREDRQMKTEVLKVYQPSLDSAERMNVMTESYEKAIKDHDQQAMLNLLYNHLGMTMGLQKGARMTRDLIHEAIKSAPWLQGMEAKFDKDGYLTGVTLTPNQMRQMVALGQQRYAEDTKKARSQAGYFGATDDGPNRIPGAATIRYYTAKANGDMTRAKALAAEDGWTVK